ncbi:MAG TPA: dihydrodipicolinate synthase family protein [Gaiellaceae bacterium]|nr:dihydrodipicolinate synthase family protein [Gaiellaceae bacterium]
MTDETVRGVFPMVVTPFAADGAVSEAEIPRVVSFVLESGCHGVGALGLGAEVGALTPEERKRIVEIVVGAAGGMPALVGCSSDETELSVALATHAAEAGASVIVVAPPPRPDWSRAELLEHYVRIASAIDPLPVMVQDAPAFVGVSLDSDFVRELRASAQNVRYVKSEAVPAADAVAELAALGDVAVFGGHGALYYLDVLDAGATGMIPGCELAAAYARIFDLHQAGERDAAQRLFTQVLPLIVAQFQSLDYFIAATKLVLADRGLIERADVRRGAAISELGRKLLLRHAAAARAAESGT